MNHRLSTAAALLSTSIWLGCGTYLSKSDDHNSGGDQSAAAPDLQQNAGATKPGQAFSVLDDNSLPPCDESREGALAYVNATKSFRTCSQGVWNVIDLRGEKGDAGNRGDKGDAGNTESTNFDKALQLYRDYRLSTFRATLICARNAVNSTECNSKPADTRLYGTAFLCGKNTVCTNAHVTQCPSCYNFERLELQAVASSVDSVNSGDTSTSPFASIIDRNEIKLHRSRDLAQFSVSQVPTWAKPTPISSEASRSSVTALMPVLSLSFPLGFQDLYVDYGRVNTAQIGECDTQGGASGYGCPSAAYDFSTSNDTDHGSSGSPLFDVHSGKVIGVTSAGTNGENANFTWAIDASLIQEIGK